MIYLQDLECPTQRRFSPDGTYRVKLQQSLSKNENLPYRELSETLMYPSTCTSPDISYAVSYLSQFKDYFNETHYKAAERILRYLKETQNEFHQSKRRFNHSQNIGMSIGKTVLYI